MCICCIWQKVKETVKDVWGFLKTFLSTEHPGLNNVADFLTVIISAASIIIAFASYNYTKDHDQPIYDVVLTSGAYQGAGSDYLSGTDFTTCIGTVPPENSRHMFPILAKGCMPVSNRPLLFETTKATTGFVMPRASFPKSKRTRMNISSSICRRRTGNHLSRKAHDVST